MKKYFLLILIFFFTVLSVKSQYYLKGIVKDEKNQPVLHANILLYSQKKMFYSGSSSGEFGIPTNLQYDSLIISADNFETIGVKVKSDAWQNIILKSNIIDESKNQPRLSSIVSDVNPNETYKSFADDETYFKLIENGFNITNEHPKTGFSLNINKASYSNARRFIKMGLPVPPDAIRTEEMVNYFNLHVRPPKPGQMFNIESQLTSCPWNEKEQLLFLNVNAKQLDFNHIPPGNFVFLIDVSGSMDMPNRLPLIKAAFQMFVKNLRNIDTVSIVTYGGFVQVWLQPTSGAEKEKIMQAIEVLDADGDTPGESAIRLAYQIAKKTFIKGGTNRVILATDGDFNVGETSEKALDDLISAQRNSGVYLTCLGVGMGNLKDSKLQTLAKKGNGNYAYLDDINEAERVLVKEISQNLYAVADDVFMNVQFNPSIVKKYRLIGFDNKKAALQINENHLEGGEMGSGSSVLAIFEIQPTDEKNYNKISTNDIVANLYMTYRTTTEGELESIDYAAKNQYAAMDSIDRDYRVASAISMFGLKLKESKYFPDKDWSFIYNFSKKSIDSNNYLQREFLTLIEKAKKIYKAKKKREE